MDTPPAVSGAPPRDLSRSPAAALVGRLAAQSGLRLAHFEHRHHLPWPETWLPADRPDLDGVPRWRGGCLVEPKYGVFRHDDPVGSFNPTHRGKWTAHELCHGLVGCAWRPDASPFFLALAAWMAEILPVALWYFFDEAGLRRCDRHQGAGPLFGAFCPRCEASAGVPVDDPRAESWRREGRAFVERELAAVARSRRLGRLRGHRHATLDLADDGLAWAARNRARLMSPTFERFFQSFHGPGLRGVEHLDELEARIVALADALCGGAEPMPLTAGADAVVAQDVAWRLLQVRAECEGEVVDALDGLLSRLADRPAAVAETAADYAALCDEWFLPPPEQMFAVGYDLDGLPYGRDIGQLARGLEQACPSTAALLEDLEAEVACFAPAEAPIRAPLARRFAAWIAHTHAGPVADVARYEAALAHPAPPDAELDGLAPRALAAAAPLRRADGVELLELGCDPQAIVAALDDVGAPVPEATGPTNIAVRRTAGGDLVVAELDPEALACLRALEEGPRPRATLTASDAVLDALLRLGLLGPASYALTGR